MCTTCTTLFPYNTDTNINIIEALNETHSDASDHNNNMLLYRPFIASDETDDNDPDTNFFQVLINLNSEYFDTDSLNQRIHNKPSPFSILHINIRSLHRNLDSLLAYLSLIRHQFPVLALSETWLTEANKEVACIPSFTHVCSHRNSRPGGGVSIFVLSSLTFTPRPDLCAPNDSFEAVFIEIDKNSFVSSSCYVIIHSLVVFISHP